MFVRRLALLALLLPSAALAVEPGDVVFTELMIAPANSSREWMELYNPTATSIDLAGCELHEGGDVKDIDALVIGSRDYAILSRTVDCAVYDEVGACVQTSDFVYTGLALGNSDGPHALSLQCEGVVIDEIAYDWEAFDGDCVGAAACSVGLDGLTQNADANDDWEESWCVDVGDELLFDEDGATMKATPWAPAQCPTSGPACGAGDVVITEMMIDSVATSDEEWFEVKVTTGSGCDLHGCEIWEGPEAEVPFDQTGDDDDDDSAGDDDDSAGDDDDDVCDDPDPCVCPVEGWKCHEIDAAGESLAAESGDYVLFAKSHDQVAVEPEIIPADYQYGTISFVNAEPGFVSLVCNDVVVETAAYDWELYQDDCRSDGCTIQVPPDAEVPATNDDPGGWCVANQDDADRYADPDDDPFFGSPGGPAVCLTREWPTAGEVVFTEFMIAPQGSAFTASDQLEEDPSPTGFPEWFEVLSVTDRTVELEGCTLRTIREVEPEGDDDDSAAPEITIQEHVIGSETIAPVLDSGDVQVMVKSKCLDLAEPEPSGVCSAGDRTDYVYGSLSFTNDDVSSTVELECPDASDPVGGDPIVVDRTVINQRRMANRSGHTIEFDPAVADPADANDALTAWCEASFEDAIDGVVGVDGEINYGTPGVAGPCKTGLVSVPPSGAGCRCEAMTPAGGAAGLLALLLFGRVRRKTA